MGAINGILMGVYAVVYPDGNIRRLTGMFRRFPKQWVFCVWSLGFETIIIQQFHNFKPVM